MKWIVWAGFFSLALFLCLLFVAGVDLSGDGPQETAQATPAAAQSAQ